MRGDVSAVQESYRELESYRKLIRVLQQTEVLQQTHRSLTVNLQEAQSVDTVKSQNTQLPGEVLDILAASGIKPCLVHGDHAGDDEFQQETEFLRVLADLVLKRFPELFFQGLHNFLKERNL